MRKRGLKITAGCLFVAAVLGLWPGGAGAFVVHDPLQTAMHEGNWASQMAKMLEQIRKLERQIELYETRIRQWDTDFKDLWGKTSGRTHDVFRTDTQGGFARTNPWFDRIGTGMAVYDDFNRITRSAGATFNQVKNVREQFGVLRGDLSRYRDVPSRVKDYYQSIGNLSTEGLYVSARTYGASGNLWGDAQMLNEMARDLSPAGAVKTANFAASVQAYAAGYQLETQNRILKQLAYQNMMKENEKRMAMQITAATQDALANMFRDLPARSHLIDIRP